MSKKYEFTGEIKVVKGHILHRIRALRDIELYNVKEGDLGGWIEKEPNLSHEGSCWVAEEACVFGYAQVSDDAKVFGYAKVSGHAWISGHVHVYGYACISDNAQVSGDVWIYGDAHIS